MYSRLPIAKRTRRGEELYLKEVLEKKHAKEKARDQKEEKKEVKVPIELINIDVSDDSEASVDITCNDSDGCVETTAKVSRRKEKQADSSDDDVGCSSPKKESNLESSEDLETPEVISHLKSGDDKACWEVTGDDSEACVEVTGEGSCRKAKQAGSDDDVVHLGTMKDSNLESSEQLETSSSEEENSHLDADDDMTWEVTGDDSEASVEITGEDSPRKEKQAGSADSDDDVVDIGTKKDSNLESSEEVEAFSSEEESSHSDADDDMACWEVTGEASLRKAKHAGSPGIAGSADSVDSDDNTKKDLNLESSEEVETSSSEEESSHSDADDDQYNPDKSESSEEVSDSCGEDDQSSEDESSRGSSPYEKKKAESGSQTQPLCVDVDDVESSPGPGHDNPEAGPSRVNENDLHQEKKAGSGDRSGDRKNVESFVVRRKRRFGMQSVAQPVNKVDHVPSARKCNSGAQQPCSPVNHRRLRKRKQSANTSQPPGAVEDDMKSCLGDDKASKDVDEANFSGQGRSKGKETRFKKARKDETDKAGSNLEIGTDKLHQKETGSSDQGRNDEMEKVYIGNPESANDVHEKETGRNEDEKTNVVSRGVVNDVEEMGTGRAENEETKGGSPAVNHEDKKKWNTGKLAARRSNRANKDCNVGQLLIDSIFQKGEGMPEGSAFSDDEASKDETNPPPAETLPQKFSFVTEEPPEKPFVDPEEAELWDEFEFYLRSSEIGSHDSNVVKNQDSSPVVNEGHTATLCRQGRHQLIFEEETGLRCKFCTYLAVESRDYLPEFLKNPYGSSGMRDRERDGPSIFDELQFGTSSDPHPGCSSHARAEGTVWDLLPGVKESMYPHQQEGFEFIWNHIAGGIHLEKLAKASAADGGNGCIISHAPGTGKTRLTIVFLQTYIKLFPKSRPLLIAPRTMLLTWEEEFRKWDFDIPFYNLNNLELSGEEDEKAVQLMMEREGRKSVNKIDNCRILKFFSWEKKRSIMGISYQLFEKLSGDDDSRAHKTVFAEEMRKMLLEFPGLVVFDEGHTPRNENSQMWKAIVEIKTTRRILLSGTPFQNNFQELNNTICLVRPYEALNLGTELLRCRGRKRKNGTLQWTYNSGRGLEDEKKMRATEYKAKIAPFVHVYKGSVLQDNLPGLRNSVVVLHPTKEQKIFHGEIQPFRQENFRYEHLEAIISIHPSLLINEEAFSRYWDRLKELKLDPNAGVKAKFLIELIRLSDALNERVLVFSQFIGPLFLVRDLLSSQFNWRAEKEVLYMDGKCDMNQRQASMQVFNDPSSEAKVLLASTRGCCEGISLVGASRVVLLDVTWNPSVERQAISRAYRLGQQKVVFVYHLLMAGTKEEDKYDRQLSKSRLSELLFSDKASNKKIRATVLEDKILEEMAQHQNLKHMFEKISLLRDEIYFENLAQSTFG